MTLRDHILNAINRNTFRLPDTLPLPYREGGVVWRTVRHDIPQDPGAVFISGGDSPSLLHVSCLPTLPLAALLAATLLRPKVFQDYWALRRAIDGTPVEELDELLHRLAVRRLSEPRSEDDVDAAPLTDIETLTAGIPWGNTCSDEGFTVRNKDYEFMLIIHYGLCYTSSYHIDLTTNSLQSV